MSFFLDGKEMQDVVQADPDLAWLDVLERHWRTGEIVLAPDGSRSTIRLRGKVRVEPEVVRIPQQDLYPGACPQCGGGCEPGQCYCCGVCVGISVDQAATERFEQAAEKTRLALKEISRAIARHLANHRER